MSQTNLAISNPGMDPAPAIVARIADPVIVRRPDSRTTPLLATSPHSGRTYPPDLLAQTRIPLDALRKSEDAYIDVLIEAAPACGITSVLAPFPRVFIDPNRSTRELDPALFEGVSASRAGATPHVQAGLGVIPRISANGRALYDRKLDVAEGRRRIAEFYRPYHGAIDVELKSARDIFGLAILLDFHSMPAIAAAGADIVLGDRHGTACDPAIMARVEQIFREEGFAVRRNRPYAGGYTTACYGKPGQQRHAVQIEINRALYLDEERVTRSGTFDTTHEVINRVLADLAATDWVGIVS